jgi:hypothetical protein
MTLQMDTNSFKYKFAFFKTCYDTGAGILSIPKYILLLLGIGDLLTTSGDTKNVLVFGFSFMFLCWFLGWLWFKYRLADAMAEVGNQYNPFVHEMRETIKS